MPAPIEYNSIRRMSTITVPKFDISFEPYDFQLCRPQTDVKDAFESRELEATFCRDFACCGLILSDLHDLLQHYEECHVRIEEEEDDTTSLADDTESNWPSPGLMSPTSSLSSVSEPSSPTTLFDDAANQFIPSLDDLKKKAAAYLSDLCNGGLSPYPSAAALLEPTVTCSSPSALHFEAMDGLDIAAVYPISSSDNISHKKPNPKKRTYAQANTNASPSALDLLSQSAAKKLALASGELSTPMTSGEFFAQAGALLASTTTNVNADKPYKCQVPGCDKAYKNPNGLKYHNQHGHCNHVSDESESILAKPYVCTIGDCGKRYKNLNGLKYHIEHSHMAAFSQTLANFGSSLLASLKASAANSPTIASPVTPLL